MLILFAKKYGNLFLLLSLFAFLTACTDYLQKMDEEYEQWQTADGTSNSSTYSNSSSYANYFTDSRDGQLYKTVKIGNQVWMAENLRYKTQNSYYYDNKISNYNMYGFLYTWSDASIVCPSGWHLPSSDEWKTLVSVVGGGSIAGFNLKSSSGWNSSNGSDAYGFTALPAGFYYSGDVKSYYYDVDEYDESYGPGFYGIGDVAWFWTSTYSSLSALALAISSEGSEAEIGETFTSFWLSVRCVQD